MTTTKPLGRKNLWEGSPKKKFVINGGYMVKLPMNKVFNLVKTAEFKNASADHEFIDGESDEGGIFYDAMTQQRVRKKKSNKSVDVAGVFWQGFYLRNSSRTFPHPSAFTVGRAHSTTTNDDGRRRTTLSLSPSYLRIKGGGRALCVCACVRGA